MLSEYPGTGLDAEKKAYLDLISTLEQLAERDGTAAAREPNRRGDCCAIWDGHVVLVHAHGRWRFGVVTGWDGESKRMIVAYMTPASLDKAQLTWWQRSREVLSEHYPAQQAAAAREAVRGRHLSTDERHEVARAAYRAAELTQHVARCCTRRRWAAVTPVLTVMRARDEIYRAEA